MKFKSLCVSVLLLLCADNRANPLSDVISSLKGFGDTAKDIGAGFASQGGYVSGDQVYSFQVFNHSTIAINPYIENYSMILGMPTNMGKGKQALLPPGQDSAAIFYGTHLYFQIKIPNTGFSEYHLAPTTPNDQNIYIYNVYEDGTGLHAEAVGGRDTVPLSDDFNGMIYNGGANQAPFSFIFSTGPVTTQLLETSTQSFKVTIPLEKDVMHLLNSVDDTIYLRPSVFSGPINQIAVKDYGLGSIITTSLTSTDTLISVNTYNYEILSNNKLVQTGFSIGNFRQASNGKMRTITPIAFTVWNPTAADLGFDNEDLDSSNLIPYTSSNQLSTWFLYTGSVYSTKQKKIIDKPMVKIPSGKAVSFYVLCPPVSKQKDMAYVFSVQSSSDSSTQQLLNQFFNLQVPRFTQDGLIFKSPSGSFSYQLPSGLANQDVSTLFNVRLPDKLGRFSKNGVNAFILYQKSFGSYAMSAAPIFCIAQAPSYAPGSILSQITQFLDLSKITSEVQANLYKQISSWVDLYNIDHKALELQIEKILLQYGQDSLKDSNQKLNVLGNIILTMILEGPCSLSKMSLLYSTCSVVRQEPFDTWVSPDNVIMY